MLNCQGAELRGSGRLVGHPVDVVSGANLDWNRDFQLDGPLPLDWIRYYDSSKNRHLGALGWGHTHEYDRRLEFDADGLRYAFPVGQTVGFPPLTADGAETAQQGLVLRRVNARTFQVREAHKPTLEFSFSGGRAVAPLSRAFQGRHQILFSHDREGRLQSILDSLGRTIQVSTDAAGRLQSLVLRREPPEADLTLLECRYDDAGNLVQCVDLYHQAFFFRYDAANRLVSQTDRRGYTFQYHYDSQGRCVRSAGDDGLLEVQLAYQPAAQTTIVTRADGGRWRYVYNERQEVAHIVDPYGGTRILQTNAQGQVVAEVDPRGAVTRRLYDAAGAPAGSIGPARDYRPRLVPGDFPEPGEHVIPSCPLEWEYGRLVVKDSIRLPSAQAALASRADPSFRPLVRTAEFSPGLRPGEPQGPPPVEWLPERCTYDETGALVRQDAPGAQPRRWLRDENGLIRRYIDGDGGAFEFHHASWNHVVRAVDPLGSATEYSYTASEEVASVKDPGGCVSEYRYDLKDRLIEVRRDGAVREQYVYDAGDGLLEKRDASGTPLIAYQLAPSGAVLERRLATGEVHTLEYDDRGRFLAAATSQHRTEFAYDVAGNRVLDARNGLGVRHRFDGIGRLMQTTVLGRFPVRYVRGPGWIKVTDPTGATHTIELLGHGLIQRRLSNGSIELAQYDRQGLCLLKAALPGPGASGRWVRAYRYSAEGDLLVADDTQRGSSRYGYDAAHRLTSWVAPGGTTEHFAYDRAGNLLEQPGLGPVQLASANRLASAGGERFAYDARGHIRERLLDGSATRYRYDARDMLVEADGPSGTVRMEYDPLGRRTSLRGPRGKREFFWDTDRLAAEIDEQGGLRIYLYADPFAVVPFMFVDYDSADADPASGRRRFVFTDQIGTPLLVTDDRGTAVWRARIAPYGEAQLEEEAIEFNLRFPGHYYDRELSLHYNRFRYYDPRLGRYLQSDPLGIAGGLNLYAYPASPLSHADIRGLACGPRRTGNPREDGQEKELVAVRALPVSNRPRGAAPFSDLPSLRGRCPNEVRDILHAAGFRQTQHERTNEVSVTRPDGTVGTRTVTDARGGSEIWMRRNPDGSYEAVRMDQHGHQRPPGMPADETFHGEPAHVHREHIPDDQGRRDSATYPPNHPSAGQPVMQPGSSNEDAASSYNDRFTPGVFDCYNDGGQQVPNNDFAQTHTPIERSSS